MSAQGKVSILIEAVNRTREASQAAVTDIERLRKARLEAQKITLEESRTLNYLKRDYRAQHAVFFDTIGVMRTVGSVGNTVLGMWNSYQLSQLNVRQTTSDLADAQIELNTALELYGEGSVVYEAAKDRVKDLTDELERMKDEELIRNIGIVMTGAGATAQVVNTVANLAAKYASVASALSAIGTVAGPAAVGIATVGGLAALAVAGGPETPTPMAELAGPGALTQAEMMAGMTYEEKFAQWREAQITIIQNNYGIENPDEIVNRLMREIADRVTR